MLTRTQLTVIVLLTMGFTLFWLWIRGEQPTVLSVAAVLGTTTTVVYSLVLLFAAYGWHLSIFRGWLVRRPDLRGTWKATLYSNWKDPTTGETVPPIEAFVVLRQTLTTLVMRLFTNQSRSISIAYAIESETDGLFSLALVYRNSPKIELQSAESPIHHGALLVEVHQVKPKSLQGHYWTDRGTRGTIELEYQANAFYGSFDDAKAALGSS